MRTSCGVVALVLVVGCGSGQDVPLTDAEFTAAAERICTEQQQKVYDASSRLSGDYPEFFPNPDFVSYFNETRAIAESTMQQLERMPLPESSRATRKIGLAPLEASIRYAAAAAKAAGDERGEEYQRLNSGSVPNYPDQTLVPGSCTWFGVGPAVGG